MTFIERTWYRKRAGWIRLLLPLAWLYAGVVYLRRVAYRHGWLTSAHPGVPVIVVGNLTVGGTGKTPLVAAIAQQLRERGRRPGIVSRGYGGGNAGRAPVLVTVDSEAREIGDEPLLLARRTGCPVMVCRRRVQAARELVSACGVDVVVADDGLQHHALARDAEIAVRDARRGYGNGYLLPAGPLREPLSRLASLDMELVQGEDADFTLEGSWAYPVSGGAPRSLVEFAGSDVHAIAGIGDPERFFGMLRAAGLSPHTHAFGDHQVYSRDDLSFSDGAPVLMTEKDAVKCASFAGPGWWYLPVTARLTPDVQRRLNTLYDRVLEAA